MAIESSPTSSSETILVSETNMVMVINMIHTTKLTTSNFLMWSRQIHALLEGYELADYIDGFVISPPPSHTTAAGIVANSTYQLWKRQDILIYSFLLGAITNAMQPLLAITTTSTEIWSTLTATYATPSRGHLKQIRQQIKYWMKGTKTIEEYFQGFTTKFDQLALLGKPLEHEDKVEYLLEGLLEDYKVLVDQIEARDTPLSLTELHEKLINFELKLQRMSPDISHVPLSANVATYKGQSSRYPSKNNDRVPQQSNGLNTWSQNSNNYQVHRQDQCTSHGYQGKCQLCGVFGHSACRCPQFSPHQSQTLAPVSPASWQPRAHLATTHQYNPTNWVTDSGATHHLTTDLHNLSLHQPCHGGEEVVIADGSSIPISQTG